MRGIDLFSHLVNEILHVNVVLRVLVETLHLSREEQVSWAGLLRRVAVVAFDNEVIVPELPQVDDEKLMKIPFAFLHGLKMATFTAATALFNALSLVARGNRSRMASSRNAVS